MKTITARNDLLTKVYYPLLLTLILSLYFFPNFIWQLTCVSYIFLIFLGLFSFTSIGNRSLGEVSTKKHFFDKNLLQICGIQMGVSIFFAGLTLLLTHGIPFSINAQHVTPNSLSFFIHASIVKMGLFPWTLYTMAAIILAYFKKPNQPFPSFTRALAPFIKSNPNGVINVGAYLMIRNGIVFSAVIFLGLISLYISKIILNLFSIELPLGPFPLTVVVFLFIYFLIFTTFSERGLIFLLKKNFSCGQILMICTSLFILAICILYPLTILAFLVFGYNPYQSFNFSVTAIFAKQSQLHLAIFLWIFMLALTPIIGRALALLLGGVNIRMAILRLVLLPILFSSVWFLNEMGIFSWDKFLSGYRFGISGFGFSLIGLSAFLAFWFLIKNRNLDQEIYATIYSEKEMCHKKFPVSFIRNVMIAEIIFAALYLFAGFPLINFFFFAAIATCFVYFICMGLGFLWLVMQR